MDHLPDGPQEARECRTHGPYMARKIVGTIWASCPSCEQQRRAEESAELARLQARTMEERARAVIGQAAIPKRFIGRTFANYKAETDAQRHALNMARQYVEQLPEHLRDGTGLIFAGKVGTGKSHLACAILQAHLPRPVLYVTCADLIRMLRETWRKDSARSERAVLSTLVALDLLVIDEVGVQYGTESEQHHLYDVLDLRWREQKPTILLTNLNMDELKALMGERTFDRLRDTCRMVPFTWESHRGLGRGEQS